MLSVDQALSLIVQTVRPMSPVCRSVAEALGCVLAEDVLADIDSPPFDKALMDGYAIRADDLAAGRSEFDVIEEVTAGRVPQRALLNGQATRIMTGAPIPAGANSVIKVEDTELLSGASERVLIRAKSAAVGQSIMLRGTSLRAGQLVVPAGRVLRAQELAALAEMGCDSLPLRVRPEIAVLTTGDELVPIGIKPGPGQIRNSNETMLAAQIEQSGGRAVPLGIARDERAHLRQRIEQGLKGDMLLLSGGVSAGKLDLVPSELANAGVEQVFHKINMKPGKPLWFGVLQREVRPCVVFGLPGNPVSTMVCFELFVRTAIRQLRGEKLVLPQRFEARLSHAHRHKDDRETYFPAAVETGVDGRTVTLMNWHGSADLQSTVDANAVAVFPARPSEYAAGDRVEVILW